MAGAGLRQAHARLIVWGADLDHTRIFASWVQERLYSVGGEKRSFLPVRWNDWLAFAFIHWKVTLSEVAPFAKCLEVI